MRQRQFYKELEKYHSWNSKMNVLDASFFAVAFACILPAVTIVAYLKHYTDNRIILNLPVFIANFSFAAAPFAASFFAGRLKRKKRAMVIGGVVHRFLWIPVILVVWLYSGKPAGVLLPLFFGAYLVFYLAWGTNGIFWREMMGRTLHPDKLSSAMGLRESIANVIGFATSFLVMYILATVAFPGNFLLLFVIAFVFLGLSLIFLAGMKEATYEGTSQEPPLKHLASIVSLPVRDGTFRWYVIFTLFSYGTLFIGGLYTSEAIDRFGHLVDSDRLAGIINVIMLCSVSLCALFTGRIYDRFGKFWGFLPVVTAATLVPLWASVATGFYAYLALFAFLGVIWNNWFLELSTVLSFAEPEKRHEYIAAMGLIKLGPIVVYTNLGGWVAEHVAPRATFMLSSVFCFVALLILVFKLRPLWKATTKKI